MRRTGKAFGTLVAATSLVLSGSGAAVADIVTNTIASTSAGKVLKIHAGGTASVGYSIKNENAGDGDTQKSCNPEDGTAVTIQTSGAPTGVTANKPTASKCGDNVATVTFQAAGTALPGTYAIAHTYSDSGGGRYTDSAGFTLEVLPPLNTAPAVTVTGVVGGASYDFGSVPPAGCSVLDTEDGSKTFPAMLSTMTSKLGTQIATCSYTDSGGLTGLASSSYDIVDTSAPGVTVPADIIREATASSTPVTWSASATDLVDGSIIPSCTPHSGTGFAVGSTTVTCMATDDALNTGSASFDVVITDTTAPSLTLPAAVTAAATDAAGAVVTYSGESALDLVDGTTTVTCLPAAGSQFPLGTTPVRCSTKDSLGNEATGAFNVTVQDKGKPVVSVPANATLEATSASGAAYTFTASATDDVDGTVTPICNASSGDTLALGTATITCTARDTAGNEGSASFTVTVADTTDPELTLPGTVTREATGASGAEATWTATAQDAVDGLVGVICSAASGSTFVLGDTTVSCRAEDTAGNWSEGTFLVVVQDTTKPSMPDLVAITDVEATGPDGVGVSYTVPGATDLVDGAVTLQCDPAPGSTFALGSTTVTCTATDQASNASTGTFAITVIDTTEPRVTPPANLVEEATSRAGAVVAYEAATSSDAVSGTSTATCSPLSGSQFAMGATTVTCTAKDGVGNEGSAKFMVTVQDTGKPVVTVPADVTVEATSGAGAAVVYGTVSASDAVDGTLEPSCPAASGGVFPLGATTVTCSAEDLSGNQGSNKFTVTVTDTTAPSLAVSPNLAVTASSSSGATVVFAPATASDLVDGAVAAACDRISGSTFAPGSTTVTCWATDAAGIRAEKSFVVSVTYGWAGAYNAPITNDGTSVHRLGSTVPVKLHLSGASARIGDLRIPLTVGGKVVGTYRYDATADQYVYNLSTRGLSSGKHVLSTDLNDGAGPRRVTITLR